MKKQMNQKIYDVIIVGAGPVGLFLACELALAKCSVIVLERAESSESPLKRIPFGIRGLSTPTIESLDRRGMLQELELHKHMKSPHQTATSSQGPRRQGGHFAGIPFLDGNINSSKWEYRLHSSPETNLISEMHEIETILTQRAEKLGVEIKRGLAVTNLHQTESEVIAVCEDQELKGRWLVGCDGARSVVRKKVGISFEGTEPRFTGYSSLVDIADPEKLKLGRNVTATGMYMQSQPGYVIIQDFDGGAFHDSKNAVTRELLQEVLRRVSNTDVTLKELHTATTWTDRARQATQYRQGRVFLAGDAAHIHAPLGGQGLNLGVGDAMNLGWKLAAVIQGRAAVDLLDSYEKERRPIGEQVLDWSRAQVAVMSPTSEGRALRAIFNDLINTQDGATYFAERVWGISTHYNLGDGHPLLGHSAPNFQFQDGKTLNEIMRAGHGVLLNFTANDQLKAIAAEYGRSLKYISGQAIERFDLDVLLIRPDGIVAWVSGENPNEDSLREAISQWLTR